MPRNTPDPLPLYQMMQGCQGLHKLPHGKCGSGRAHDTTPITSAATALQTARTAPLLPGWHAGRLPSFSNHRARVCSSAYSCAVYTLPLERAPCWHNCCTINCSTIKIALTPHGRPEQQRPRHRLLSHHAGNNGRSRLTRCSPCACVT